MSLYKPPNSANWYYSISHQGQRYRNTTGTADKKQAQELHDKIKHDLWREKLGERYITFGEACAQWLKAMERDEADRYRVRALLERISEGTSLRDVSSEAVHNILADKGNSTKRRYINLISAICRLSGHNPNLKRPAVKEGRIRWLTKREWQNLRTSLKSLSPHLLPIADFAISTGLRSSNILNLEWSQCDLKRSLMWIHPDQSKSGKPISIPLSTSALTILRRQRGISEKYVFPYYTDGTPITRVTNHGWKAACKAAGLEDIVFHDLRRTWTVWHLMSGTPIPVVQKLGGWNSIEILMKHYGHFAASHVSEYANNSKPRS